MQNELISIISNHIPRNVLPKNFSIIVDETMGISISHNEQVSICVRYVDDTLSIHEHFLGFWNFASQTSEVLTELITSIFKQFGLEFKNLVGQCYDGPNCLKIVVINSVTTSDFCEA